MAYKIEGETCPICKSYLFNEDDVVFCPICGAPHHRDCYKSVGHCGMAEFHGTDKQYRPKTGEETAGNTNTDSRCPRCHHEKIEGALFCPHCGYDFLGGTNQQNNPRGAAPVFPGFADPYGGIPHDGTVTIDGESVEDVKQFVFSNTQRYVPLFYRLNKKKKTSWNWAAFLIPQGWLFFRKNYTAGIIALALVVLSYICLIPLTADLNALMSSGSQVVQTSQEQAMLIMSLMPKVPLRSIIIAAVGWTIGLATNIYFGLMGDWHYRQYVLGSIREIRKDHETDKQTAFFKKGATSIVGFLLAYMITQLIPEIAALFI